MPEPVIVKINRTRCVLMGLAQGILGFCLLMLAGGPIWILRSVEWLTSLALVLGFVFLGVAAFYFGLARRQPVVLRMDDNGISGYYVDPASWKDIRRVFAFEGPKGQKFLGFQLIDPTGFGERQTPWRRYFTATNGRRYSAHLVVPEMVVNDTDVTTLAQQASELLARSSETADIEPDAHNHVT